MRLVFKETSAEEITGKIRDHIENETRYGKIVSVEPSLDSFTIVIQKLGTSKILFCHKEGAWQLEKEKIAFSHRAYKEKVFGIIKKITLRLGGDVKLS